jgi:hypothetical protein
MHPHRFRRFERSRAGGERSGAGLRAKVITERGQRGGVDVERGLECSGRSVGAER